MYSVPGEEVNILGIYTIGHSEQKNCVCTCVLLRTDSEIELFHCTDEQHAMSSHELQK
jgi:hypothetical protein